MKTKTISSDLLSLNDRRLDSGPYLSGAFEAKIILNRLTAKKEPLYKTTKGGMNGIFSGPRFARAYVDDPAYGVPFLGSTDILMADLATLPMLSKRQVRQQPELVIDENWTLITCSGTIGRMVFSTLDMKGMAGSQHFMRVVPDADKILPGYLYVYLSSKFGVPQVVSGTYGAIIQHIEPQHIANLSVPRLGKVEQQAHELITEAAQLRVEANGKFQRAGALVNRHFGFPAKLALSHRVFSTSKASSHLGVRRIDATFHESIAQMSDALLRQAKKLDNLIDIVTGIGETARLRQVFVDSPTYGVPFLTSGEIFRLTYEPERFLSKRLLPADGSWAVKEGDTLIARSGQVGGIIGRGVWADKRLEEICVSVDVLRLHPHAEKIKAGYLFAYLCLTDVGYRQLARTAAGSSIPHLLTEYVEQLKIPRASSAIEEQADKLVWEAGRNRAEAQAKEMQARQLVEHAIEGIR